MNQKNYYFFNTVLTPDIDIENNPMFSAMFDYDI